MTAMAPNSPMSCHVGEITLVMMSAANANSSPRRSHTPKRRQMAFRIPWEALGLAMTRRSLNDASREPKVTTRTAATSMSRTAARAAWMKSSSTSALVAASHDAAETNVTGRRVNRLRKARRGPIAATVVRRAQMRSAFQHFAWNSDQGLGGIVAVLSARSERVPRNAARLDHVGGMLGAIPVGGPLPDVPDHVKQSIPIRRVRADGRRSLVSVAWQALPGKLALPGIRHVTVVRQEFVAPRIGRSLESASRRKLPLSFRREHL